MAVKADLSALSSGVAASLSWVAPLTDLLQLVATGIAIVTGIYAIRWHRARLRELRRVLRATKMYKGTKYEELK